MEELDAPLLLLVEVEEHLPLLLLVEPLLEGVQGVHAALVLRTRRPANIFIGGNKY